MSIRDMWWHWGWWWGQKTENFIAMKVRIVSQVDILLCNISVSKGSNTYILRLEFQYEHGSTMLFRKGVTPCQNACIIKLLTLVLPP
jgi:hypothetical protein